MSKTVEELMRVRYKVIANYPLSPYEINEVIPPELVSGNGLDKYPAIFRKLEWWEDREVSEMPPYIKYWDTSLFFPVDRFCKLNEAPFNAFQFTAENFQPATESEYNQYIASKK